MKPRTERERELQRMSPTALLELYRRVYEIPPGDASPSPGTLLIAGILRKEYPDDDRADAARA
jgi:hypothetical protein